MFTWGWGEGKWEMFNKFQFLVEMMIKFWRWVVVGGLHKSVYILSATEVALNFSLCKVFQNRQKERKIESGAGCLIPVTRNIQAEAA